MRLLPPPPPDHPGFNWGLLGAIVGALLADAAAVALVVWIVTR